MFGVHSTTRALRELRVQLVLSRAYLCSMEFILALQDFQMQQSIQRNSVALASLLSTKDAGSPTSCVAAVSHIPGLCAHCLVERVKVENEQLGHTQARTEAGTLEPMVQDKPPLHRRTTVPARLLPGGNGICRDPPSSQERWLGSVIKSRNSGMLSITMTTIDEALSTINSLIDKDRQLRLTACRSDHSQDSNFSSTRHVG